MDWIFVVVPGIIWRASFLFIAEGLRVGGRPDGRHVLPHRRIRDMSLVPAARAPIARTIG